MNEANQHIEKIVYSCFKEIADHTLQSEVISPHIKNIKNNLEYILNHLKKCSSKHVNFTPRNREKTIAMSGKKNAVIRIAYAMSRFDYHIINDILKSDFNQTETFEFLAAKLNVKATTQRNYRDRFDPYVKQEKSNRKGWYQMELLDALQAVKKEYDEKDYTEIKNEIETFLTDPAYPLEDTFYLNKNFESEDLSMETHKIISVEIVSGSSLNNNWQNDMQKIETDKGSYIDNMEGGQFGFFKDANPGFDWSSKIGKTVEKIKVFHHGGFKWLNKQ